ncbi:RNA polymerase sigma factor [Kriegella aquimaris]|uniref:RNA polymerase sigma-70 factor, ECF subfamily n=1 Tax=Kriegella aquimaris TaxID=192904 RepID=A0A1G9J687_9FLAO|nr:RNA polymerase sigma-70 factor [Kriegella aquimaris]SDL33029.1 RNA polymerase sigma-70 factor, ECF subfamily [Kriegella aquimaris]
MNTDNSALLVERLKKGEEEAFIYLVDRYNRRLFGYAMTLTSDHAQAEDILQNVFLRTWEQRKKLDIKSSLQNYLFKSVYNEFINQYKKNRSTMILEQKYFEGLERAVILQEDSSVEKVIARITNEIHNLPPKCKEVFLLSRKEGLTNLEISEHLNVSIKTVEAQLTKAFGVLRKKMGKTYKTMLFLLFGGKQKIEFK